MGTILILGNFPCCLAQFNSTVYEDFNQTLVNPYLINPSATDTSYSFMARLNNINELGFIRNVSKFYFDGDKRLGSSEEHNFHFIGIQILNSKFGDYLSRSRLQFRYSWFARLSKRSALSSGISLGFVNYAFLTTQGGTGGSDFGPDGSVGIHYLRKNTSIGFAIQQIFTPVLIPVNQSFRLNRLYNFDFSRKFNLTSRINLASQFVLQLSDVARYSYGINMLSSFYDIGMVGVSNFNLRKTTFSTGVKHDIFLNYNVMLLISYSIYHYDIAGPDNSLEIFIAIRK